MLDVKYKELGGSGLVTTPLNMVPNLSECNVSHAGIAQWTIIQSQAWLRLQCLFKVLLWPRCEFLLCFREDRILRLTYKTLECLLQIKTEGTDPVLFDSSRAVDDCHWWCKCQGKCQPCYIVMRITVNSVCHA